MKSVQLDGISRLAGTGQNHAGKGRQAEPLMLMQNNNRICFYRQAGSDGPATAKISCLGWDIRVKSASYKQGLRNMNSF